MEDHGPDKVKYSELGDDDFDKFVEDTLKEFHTPGMAVLVVHGEKTSAKAYGYAYIAQKVRTTPETLFCTASTTKSFTSAMAAHLVESPQFPQISWTTPLAELIPNEFILDQTSPEGRWATDRVTLEDALSHRTGMPRHDLIWINGAPTNEEIVRLMRYVPLHHELRLKWEYGNLMYTAVSHAVESKLQQPYKDLLKEHVFEPLGMKHSTYALDDARTVVEENEGFSLATPYLWDSLKNDYEEVPWSDIAPSKGSGGIISNVLDYSLWVRHLMKPKDLNGALSSNVVKQMRTPRMLVEPDPRKPYVGPQAYCLGLYSQVYRGREILQHSGASPGHMTTMLMAPPRTSSDAGDQTDEGWAVVIMQNTYSLAQDIVAWHLLDDFLETPSQERHDMAEAARDAQAKKEETLQPEKVVERLFGAMGLDPSPGPMLPLKAYEGTYRHVAYHDFNISISPSSRQRRAGTSNDGHEASAGSNESGHLLFLTPGSSQQTYCAVSATLHHVSGDWWWALRSMGPKSWITDEAVKVQFVVGSDNQVTGMRFQAEPAMPEFLAFFDRVE